MLGLITSLDMIDETSEMKEAKHKLETGSEHARSAWGATTEAAKNVGTTIKKEATEAFATGKEYLGKAVQSFGEAASETYDVVRGQASETAQAYRAKAKCAMDEVSVRAKNVQAKAEDYIRTYPLKAVGIAVGVGALLAAILRKRR